MFRMNIAMMIVILPEYAREMPWRSAGLHCHTHYHS